MKSIIAAAGLVAVAQAFTQPGAQTYGSLLTPNTDSPVTTGQTYEVTWDPSQPTDGVTVSLVLCNGPGANCVLQSAAIVENVPAAAGSYSWSVPCSLPAGVQSTATGYGMLIIVDGTGEFQYSTQFSVIAGDSCGSSGTSSSSSSSSSSESTSSSSSAAPTGPPSSPTSSGWNTWESSSTMSTSTVSVPAAPSTPVAVTTSQAASTTHATYSSSTSAGVSTTPQAFTGAAAMPTAFVNAAGIFGAAALAALAL